MTATRISVKEAYARVETGEALLVCAYDSEEKFNQYRLSRAISLGEFASRLAAISKTRELIFYCA